MWDLTRLVQFLTGNGFAIAVETQGTIWRDWLLKTHMVVISPKSPGMGEKFEPEKFSRFVAQLVDNRKAFAIKVVIFSAIDIEFAVDIWQAMEPNVPEEQHGLFFLSLGNPFPPVLDEELNLIDNPTLRGEDEFDATPHKDHRVRLLECYAILAEEVCQDPRIQHMRFLPQLHVLAWSNESKR
jgi:7-carboxy-7-deazaguanine synthase